MKRLILHIGPHKTGSTSFQHWLRRHAGPLSAAGIAVPLDFVSASANGAPLAKAMMAPAQDRTADQSEMLADFAAFCRTKPARHVLLSAEAFSKMLYTGKAPQADSTATDVNAARTRRAQALHAATSALGFDRVDIVALIRDPVARLTSTYIQTLKSFNFRMAFVADGARDVPLTRFSDSFAHLSDLGFHVRAAPYADPADPRPLAERLMACAGLRAGLPEGIFAAERWQNVSPGWLRMIGLGHLFWLAARGKDPWRPALAPHQRQALIQATADLELAGDGPLTLFTPHAAQALNQRQMQHDVGIERWTDGLTAPDIARGFAPARPQSPLCYSALDGAARGALNGWLSQVADRVAACALLGPMIAPDALRAIAATPPGVHSAPTGPALQLGLRTAAAHAPATTQKPILTPYPSVP